MIAGKKVLALVAARGGSKGVPKKNIIEIDGRPLIQWTIEAARSSNYIDRLILSSDDAEIIDAASAAGCDVPFRRDAALATDDASTIDVVIDALRRVSGYDIVVLLQPTSPLRIAADIDGALELLISTGAPACVTVRETKDHPYWTFGIDDAGRLSRFVEPVNGMPSRRQDLPTAWSLNGAVYAADCNWLSRSRSFVSEQTVAYPMSRDRSLDIDTVDDIERLKQIVGGLSASNGESQTS